MHRVVWRAKAEEDLLGIVEHIAQDSIASAEKLADEIEAKAAQLSSFPALGRAGRKRGTRELVMHPNYIVIYRVLKQSVDILRVKHAALQ